MRELCQWPKARSVSHPISVFFASCGLNNNSQRSELEFNIACRFCDSALDCVFRKTCFKLCRPKLLQHNPGGMVVTSVVQWYLRLFCFGKVKCYHIGCLNNGKFCLVYPAWHILRQPSLDLRSSIDLLSCSFWVLFKCCVSWNGFK